MTLLRNTNVTFQDSLFLSEFAELRTANPGNRFDFDAWSGAQGDLFIDDTSTGAGSATFDANARDFVLTPGGTNAADSGGKASHYPVPYTPGSGQEIDITGTMNAANKPGTMYIFLRSTVTGSATIETVEQVDWSAATTGVNWQYSQILRMSFQSLRVGRIQFALVRDGLPVKVAQITNDNERATGYWQYAVNRPYWRVFHDGANTVTEFGYGDSKNGIGFRFVMDDVYADATARAVCATVKSQGGAALLDMSGTPWATPVTAAKTVSTTLIPVVSVRVAALYSSLENLGLVIPSAFSVQTSNPVRYQLTLNPTLTGASFAAINATYSGVEFDTAATAVTGGYTIKVDTVSAGTNSIAAEAGLLGKVIMSLNAKGVADILTLSAIRTGAQDAAVWGFIDGREIR